jgi:hypothetical protein
VFEVVTLPVGAAKLAKIKTVVDASKVANAIKTTDHAADLAHAANAAGDAAHAADQAADAARAADQASDAARAAGMCFAAGTPVVTAEGLRAIEALRAGDMVLSRHEHTGETDWRRIVRTFERPVEGLVRLALRDGSGRVEALDTTDEHPFWVSGRGWVGAASLEAGQQLGAAAERALVVESVTSVAVSTSVYNFEVDGFHTYFVGETAAWVHNQCMTPAPTVLRDVIATNRSAIVNHGQDLTYYPRTPRPGQVRVTPPSEMEATRLPGAAIDQADNYLQDVWVLENKYETIISPSRIVVPPPAAGRLNTVSVRVHHLDLDAWQRGQMVERYRNPTVVGGSNPALTSVTQMPNGPAVFTHVQPPGLDKIPLQVKSSPGGGFFGDISIVTRPPP